MQHAFVRRNLSELEPDIERIAVDAATNVADMDRFDFIEDFSARFTVRVLSAALGLPPGDEEIVREKAVLMVQNDPVTREKGPEHVAAYEWMKDYAAGVIAERRRSILALHVGLAAQQVVLGVRRIERDRPAEIGGGGLELIE